MSDQPAPALDRREQRTVLSAFSRAIDRESHNLSRWPDMIWQQLYNRLQWEGERVAQVLEPALERRMAPGATPWMRRRMRRRESDALLRTLAGHGNQVQACAISPDGAFIVSASYDRTLKVWDAQTGQERATLVGHGDRVQTCAISPDGAFILSGSDDRTIRISDARTGQERARLNRCVLFGAPAISPDGALIVSASYDRTLKVWDAQTGQERATLAAGHGNFVEAFAISPDGVFIVSAGFDRTLTVCDAQTGQERAWSC